MKLIGFCPICGHDIEFDPKNPPLECEMCDSLLILKFKDFENFQFELKREVLP